MFASMTDNTQFSEIAFDAYQYFYPLVIMDLTRKQATNVATSTSEPMKAPVNQFAHFREFPEGDSRDVVRFNFDTLYSFAWVDTSSEPIVLTVPDSGGRYYLTPILDMWTDVFAVPGTRTTQGKKRSFALTAPGWTGSLPQGVDKIECPTPTIWIMGRTQVNGRDDLPIVHAIQDGLSLVPLSAHGTDYVPPTSNPIDSAIDNVTPPLIQVNSLTGSELLEYGAELLKVHAPHPNDYPILLRLEQLGFVVGQSFPAHALSAETQAMIDESGKAALADLISSTTDGSLGISSGGWITFPGGTYGTEYRHRGMIALAGLGCNLTEDALYSGVATDQNGELLNGANNYVLHFDKNQIPQTNAFWSLTMYDIEGFQVPNVLDRFAIGDRDQLKYGADGSLEVYIQAESPGAEKESNWLPSPTGPFQPMVRMYSPDPKALRKSLKFPPITRVN